jgi:hypothetical protein
MTDPAHTKHAYALPENEANCGKFLGSWNSSPQRGASPRSANEAAMARESEREGGRVA